MVAALTLAEMLAPSPGMTATALEGSLACGAAGRLCIVAVAAVAVGAVVVAVALAVALAVAQVVAVVAVMNHVSSIAAMAILASSPAAKEALQVSLGPRR